MTARTLAAGAGAVFAAGLLSAGLAYAIAGCLLTWWLLVDLGRGHGNRTPSSNATSVAATAPTKELT